MFLYFDAHNLSILLTTETFWIFLLIRKSALRKWQKDSKERKSYFNAHKVAFPKLTGESIWLLGINSPHTLIQFLSVPHSNCSTPMQSIHYSAFCFLQWNQIFWVFRPLTFSPQINLFESETLWYSMVTLAFLSTHTFLFSLYSSYQNFAWVWFV